MSSNIKIIEDLLNENSLIFKNFTNKKNFNNFKNFKKFKTIIIIGMGGSVLGAKSIYGFLKFKIKKKFIFVDNLDEYYLMSIKKKNNLSKSLFLIISKSGNTTETILNTYFFRPYLKKKNTIILSEKTNSFLRNLAQKNNFCFVEHKKFVGGRYSVLTDVGMLPAYLMDLDTMYFKKDLNKLLNKKKLLNNSVNEINRLKLKKTNILILLNYIPELNNFLYWCQQLFAESLGKHLKGFLPVVSNAPKDHHSLLQLYLDGPKDKVFYVFSHKKSNSKKIKSGFFEKDFYYLNNKNYNDVKISQKNAFLNTLKSNGIPFREILVRKFDENTIGKLFLSFIFETIYLGKMMKINPFDQPAVEQVKTLTKKILKLKKF